MDKEHPGRRLQDRHSVLSTSIRQWLLVWQISALIVITLAVTLITYHLAWDGFNRIRDHSLEQIAHAILFHPQSHNTVVLIKPEETDKFVSQTWNTAGELIFASRPQALLPRQPPGLSTFEWEGEEWHAMVLESDGLIVQVANSLDSRYRLFNTLGPWLLLPFAGMIFVLGGLILIAVNRALAPLMQLRAAVRERSPENLVPFPEREYPQELGPLVDSLNDLLRRLRQAFVIQQRFIADAAHELRSPLTAVRLQAQVASHEERADVREEALGRMRLSVDRASHLVDQLLSLARFDPQFGVSRPFVRVDLLALAKTVVVEKSVLAEAAGLDLGLLESDSAWVSGDAEGLQIMLGNLVDNAIRYAVSGETIDVAVSTVDGLAVCRVVDHGPGIPAEARGRVLEPFCRLAGQELPGSGLGLAIVAEIVSLHGGRLDLEETPGGGLTVRLTFSALIS